jgi:DNA-binding transcriptional ArsR family regulator
MSEGEADRMERLERQLTDLGERLAALERVPAGAPTDQPAPPRPGMPTAPPRPGPPGPGMPAPPPRFRSAVAEGQGSVGADDESEFAYSGRARFGGQMLYIEQQGRLADVMNANPDRVAKVFAALASPARIVLVRALLDGPRTSQELRQELDDPSVGQLYHHLKELLAAGLVIQPGRSVYALPRGSQIALCLQIVAAASLLPTGLATQPPEPEEEEGDPAREDGDG